MRGRRLPNPARKPSQLLSWRACCGKMAGAGVAVLVLPRGLGSAVLDTCGIPLAGAAVPPRGPERGGQLCCVPCTVVAVRPLGAAARAVVLWQSGEACGEAALGEQRGKGRSREAAPGLKSHCNLCLLPALQ